MFNQLSRRRILWGLTGIALCAARARASGHNSFCTFRDSGGAYLREKRVFVAGSKYRDIIGSVRRDHEPVTVLVENDAHYIRAVRDIQNPAGPYPPGSIVVRDITAKPESSIEALDVPLRSIQRYYSIPRTAEEAIAIHGDAYSKAALGRELPRLTKFREEINASGGVEIRAQQGRSAADVFRAKLSEAGPNDLFMVLGHRVQVRPRESSNYDPVYEIRFHDKSTLRTDSISNEKPTVWLVSCDTWSLYASRELGDVMMATARPLSYRQGASMMVRAKGLSRRQVIHSIQQRPLPRAEEAVPANTNVSTKPVDTTQEKQLLHDPPTKPSETPDVFVVDLFAPNLLGSDAVIQA